MSGVWDWPRERAGWAGGKGTGSQGEGIRGGRVRRAATVRSPVNLPGANLDTEDLIQKYLGAVQKGRGVAVRKQRSYANPYQLDLRFFGF
jgi:hypothetical protein